MTIHLSVADDAGQAAVPDFEEVKVGLVPLAGAQVHQVGPAGIGDCRRAGSVCTVYEEGNREAV